MTCRRMICALISAFLLHSAPPGTAAAGEGPADRAPDTAAGRTGAPASPGAGPDGTETREIASYTIVPELKFMTDSRTRGMSDSLGPAAQMSLFAAHESGLVGLLQLTNVSSRVFTDAVGVNVTAAAGYRVGESDGLHGGVGAAAEFFPGARFIAPYQIDYSTGFPNPVDNRNTTYDTQYGVFELGYGALEGRILVVLSKEYRGANTGGVCGQLLFVAQFRGSDPTKALNCYSRGVQDARGTLLFDLDYSKPFLPDLIPNTTYRLHVGYQKVANFPEADTIDYKIGLTHTRWNFDFTLEYIGSLVKTRDLYLVASGARLVPVNGDAVVFSVARKF